VFICSTRATLDGGEPKSLLLIERRDGLTTIINILGWLGMWISFNWCKWNTVFCFVCNGSSFYGFELWCLTSLSTIQMYFSYIMAVSFIGGGTSNQRKPPTCRKSQTNFYQIKLYLVHITMNGILTLVVIDPDCIVSCKSKYHSITTMTTLLWFLWRQSLRLKYF
jgi:hypothetical protein